MTMGDQDKLKKLGSGETGVEPKFPKIGRPLGSFAGIVVPVLASA